MDTTDLREEDCRFAVLKALKARSAGAHDAEVIRSVFLRAMDFTQDEVDQALALLETAGHVKKVNRPSPSVGVAWQITMEGVTAYARR